MKDGLKICGEQKFAPTAETKCCVGLFTSRLRTVLRLTPEHVGSPLATWSMS